MKDFGFRTLAIDKTASRTEGTHIATYELSCDDQVDSMEKDIDNLINKYKYIYISTLFLHAAPPQGHLNAHWRILNDKAIIRLQSL